MMRPHIPNLSSLLLAAVLTNVVLPVAEPALAAPVRVEMPAPERVAEASVAPPDSEGSDGRGAHAPYDIAEVIDAVSHHFDPELVAEDDLYRLTATERGFEMSLRQRLSDAEYDPAELITRTQVL